MKLNAFAGVTGRAARAVAVVVVFAALAGCSLFGPQKIVEEEIIPPDTLYQTALKNMDESRYNTAIATLAKLERQHPYSEYAEKAKLMTVYANFRIGKYSDAILAADRYTALYPSSPEVPYVIYLKGSSSFAQIKDITRDQQLAQDTIDTFKLLISSYPDSKYVPDAKDKMALAYDQLAGKEMSVGRYYEGNGKYVAAINRFRNVVENYQTTSHIEEALFRLTESYLALGLVNEAETAAAVLGHNYPSGTWYKDAFNLLKQQGLTPQVAGDNWMTQAAGGTSSI
ncbi:MAG TPA: outer membrane protein assembly factor BamD [Devosiaceae bacterium]